jgi:hypothetical protein
MLKSFIFLYSSVRQMLLNTLCRSAANDALALSETTPVSNECADGFCDMWKI